MNARRQKRVAVLRGRYTRLRAKNDELIRQQVLLEKALRDLKRRIREGMRRVIAAHDALRALETPPAEEPFSIDVPVTRKAARS